MVNLYAFRATSPADLHRTPASGYPDPVGPENDTHIRAALRRLGSSPAPVICAWGASPHAGAQARHVNLTIWAERGRPWCLGRTKDGHPRHPLYLAGATILQPF